MESEFYTCTCKSVYTRSTDEAKNENYELLHLYSPPLLAENELITSTVCSVKCMYEKNISWCQIRTRRENEQKQKGQNETLMHTPRK